MRLSHYQRKLRKTRQLSLADWGDLLLACFDLAIARVILIVVQPVNLITHDGFTSARKSKVCTAEANAKRVERVVKAIALAARYVPWRSDCLIQALAAKRRLNIAGLDSELRLGVRKNADGSFAAHAWLLQGETMVTGGDVSEFSRLI